MAGFNHFTISSVEIILAEILNNIVEHAIYQMPEGWFYVECKTTETTMLFQVRDNGCPMPNNALPKGRPPNINRTIEKLPEGGWGWSLVHTLAENLTYVRTKQINHVTFNVPIILTKSCD